MDASWTIVDDIDRPSNLTRSDVCFYYYMYTPGGGCSCSWANSDVLNYKIAIDALKSNPDRMQYKLEAIETYATAMVSFFEKLTLRSTGERVASLGSRVGLVPIPPSKMRTNNSYDDRNTRVCNSVSSQFGFKVCCDVETTSEIGESHAGGPRDPTVIKKSLSRVSDDCNSCELVFLVDDVLTSGAHFVAVKDILEATGCGNNVYGLFFARSMR